MHPRCLGLRLARCVARQRLEHTVAALRASCPSGAAGAEAADRQRNSCVSSLVYCSPIMLTSKPTRIMQSPRGRKQTTWNSRRTTQGKRRHPRLLNPLKYDKAHGGHIYFKRCVLQAQGFCKARVTQSNVCVRLGFSKRLHQQS